MTLCGCDRCFCASQVGGRKATPCLFCEMGEHSAAPREANRIRVCRSCQQETVALDEWPAVCLNPECGADFGPVALGFDRVSVGEAWAPMTKVADLNKALSAHKRAVKKGMYEQADR